MTLESRMGSRKVGARERDTHEERWRLPERSMKIVPKKYKQNKTSSFAL